MRTITLAFVLALIPSWAQSADLTGNARVIDGDTIEIAGTRVRLAAIDAPEHDQTCQGIAGETYQCGRDATAALVAIIENMPVACSPEGRDRYGRTIATCRTERGDINAAMVRHGWAIDYAAFSHGRYHIEEAAAQKEHLGIWSGRFVMPEQWRHRHRE